MCFHKTDEKEGIGMLTVYWTQKKMLKRIESDILQIDMGMPFCHYNPIVQFDS